MSVFTEKLTPKTTGLPEQALSVILSSLEAAHTLTVEHNDRVSRINEAKASDPNNVEVLDAKWKTLADSGQDAEIVELEENYQSLTAELEKVISQLREKAKAQIQPPLSTEEAATLRKTVNEGKSAIEAARNAAAGQADIVDAMMSATGSAIEGGVMSLLPDLLSLKGGGGRRKSGGSGDGKIYATRANDIAVNGKSVAREVNGKRRVNFEIAAAAISELIGNSEFPQNTVAPETLEKAYYDSLGIEFRSKDIPDSHEFEFVKDVTKQGKNGEITEPVTFKVKHFKWTAKTDPKTEKVPNAEKKADAAPVEKAPAKK